nr:MAG TPA: hypothetical protein [Bacteriophage sp.]DAR98936.1 MAG TPA: hypothetical protein [Bacteriophage sp.]DAZ80829.1 MAG TPA: hypothetical protein [Caudoviricetes sp.]
MIRKSSGTMKFKRLPFLTATALRIIPSEN